MFHFYSFPLCVCLSLSLSLSRCVCVVYELCSVLHTESIVFFLSDHRRTLLPTLWSRPSCTHRGEAGERVGEGGEERGREGAARDVKEVEEETPVLMCHGADLRPPIINNNILWWTLSFLCLSLTHTQTYTPSYP